MVSKTLNLSVTKCYLFRSDNGYALVDTGYDWEWHTFQKELKRLSVRAEDIKFLILTHHHDDHVGLINRLLEQNPGTRIVMSDKARELVARGKNDHVNGGGYINKRINAILKLKRLFDKKWTHTFPPYFVRNDDVMIHQEVSLRQIGIATDGKIIETPGHSIDCISIALGDGDCIVGDAAANFLQFAGTKHCVIYLEDLEQYYRSWNKIIEAGAKNIFPSHGVPFRVEKLRKYMWQNQKRNMVMIA
jgi:glyoxylase-like metal-dependent hydrolase (beta-lactamase superfamily II)